jgi:hypothetical protein
VKINVIILALAFFLSLCVSAWAADRDLIIEKEMNCVANHIQNGVTWSDVCSMDTAAKPRLPAGSPEGGLAHDIIVTEALNKYDETAANGPAVDNEPVVDQAPLPETNQLVIEKPVAKFSEHYLEDKDRPFDLDTQFNAGYRIDKLQWSIAGLNNYPDVLSELTWSKVQSFIVEDKGTLALQSQYVLDWSIDYGWIFHGSNQDSDYFSSGHQNEFSRSNNSADIGHVFDVSGGAGLRFSLTDWINRARTNDLLVDNAYLDLLVGYSFNEQKYFMTDANQTIPATGDFPGLKSNYDATWKSPWLGFQLKGQKERSHGFFRFEYHFVDYYGKANWNLRDDFEHPKSYEQEADKGFGFVFAGGAGFLLTPSWSLDAAAKWQYMKAYDGTDTKFLSDGTTLETKYNKVEWNSATFTLGNTIRF